MDADGKCKVHGTFHLWTDCLVERAFRQSLTSVYEQGVKDERNRVIKEIDHFIEQEKKIQTDDTVQLLTDLKKSLKNN